MSVFDDILSFHDAATIWGIDDSTLRKAVASGRLIDGEDCKKYGKQWVILISAMVREFGGWAPWSRYCTDQLKKKNELLGRGG